MTRKTRAGTTIAFTYDTLNRLLTKAAPLEPTVSYVYDLASHLIGVSDNSAAIAPPATSASYTTNLTYDQLNRALTVNWFPAPTQTTPSAVRSGSLFYYDATNRRIREYTLDKSWWSYPTTAKNVSYTANNLNQYTAVGSASPSYDGNGNLTSDGTFTYGYDAENRLISASGTGLTAGYAYDAQGRRKSKTVNGTTTIFVTDANNREVLEYNGSTGAIQNWYAYALGPNDALNQMNVAAGTRATLIPDILGSFIGALDATSGSLTKFGYQTYGESGSTTGSFRYTGQRIDPETNGLYYYRARMYIPSWGRFSQPDPTGYSAGVNLYAFVGNDPLNKTDATGLAADNPQPSSSNSDLPSASSTNSSLAQTEQNQATSQSANQDQTIPSIASESGTTTISNSSATSQLMESSLSVAGSPDSSVAPPPSFQLAQGLPPLLFEEPPLVVRPPLPQFPQDYAKPPGPGWEWRGAPGSQPGDPQGNYYNPGTNESLHPDPEHPPPLGPHYDYRAPDGQWYRWFPDGSLELKS